MAEEVKEQELCAIGKEYLIAKLNKLTESEDVKEFIYLNQCLELVVKMQKKEDEIPVEEITPE
jgi:hypothetical protein